MTPLRDIKNLELLREVAVLQERQIQRLEALNADLAKELMKLKGGDPTQLQTQVELLQEQLLQARQRTFGDSSEQRPAPKPEAEKTPAKGHGPTPQPSLPIVEEIHRLDEPDRVCPQCGGALQEWADQFEVSEEVDVVVRRIVLRKHKRQKYRCGCGGCVETALGPVKLIPGGRYSTNFAIEVAVDKYLDHMPLERQVRRFEREGLEVTSQSLFDQIAALADLLAPLHDRLHAYVVSKPVIGADETHWKYLGRNGEEHTQKRWQVWTVVTVDAVSYRIEDSRSKEAARRVLASFAGTITADGYNVYEFYGGAGVRIAFCWAHVRRKFFELENIIDEKLRTEILDLIGELYAVEREAGDELERRRALRAERSVEIIERIRAWLLDQHTRALPRSGFGKAIAYALKRWDGLRLFLADPLIPIDNNWSERALRGPVVGRKNHYGSKSERGTRVAATLYSVLESAKLVDIDPKAYLAYAVRLSLADEQPKLPHEVGPDDLTPPALP